MKFTALGGGIPLGGSHYLIELEGKRIAIDCGAIQNQGGKVTAPPIANGKIDALFMTHGHFDHDGMLPLFAKRHPETPIYGTKVTRRFASMLLWDSLKITQDKIEAGQNVDVFFNAPDIVNALSHKRFMLVHRPEWFSPWPGWRIRFRPANHINGAAMIDIITPRNLRITHSGDLSFNDLPTIGGPIDRSFKPDVLVTEATYGERILPERTGEESRLGERVVEVLRRGGQALIPTFSIAGPNIAIIVARYLKQVGIDIPVHIDGMIRKAASIINLSSEWSENDNSIAFPNNLLTMPDGLAGYAYRRELLSGPAVILASHGMLEGGKVMEYLPTVLPNPLGAVLIHGYQAEGTGGRKLLELERGSNFLIPAFGHRPAQVVQRYCDVERFYLSSHASGNEIAAWIHELEPRTVIVTHATEASFNGLRQKIGQRQPSIKVLGAYNGQELNDIWN